MMGRRRGEASMSDVRTVQGVQYIVQLVQLERWALGCSWGGSMQGGKASEGIGRQAMCWAGIVRAMMLLLLADAAARWRGEPRSAVGASAARRIGLLL